jgi:hypothetical protein
MKKLFNNKHSSLFSSKQAIIQEERKKEKSANSKFYTETLA